MWPLIQLKLVVLLPRCFNKCSQVCHRSLWGGHWRSWAYAPWRAPEEASCGDITHYGCRA
eukprot:14403089-Alexandrium_andersonii.AAC.2